MSECLNCGRDCGVLRYRGLCKWCVKAAVGQGFAYDEGRRHALQASQGDSATVDFAALAAELRKARKPKPQQAMLIEFMADKEEATVEDVARVVHGHDETSTETIRMNVRRTNESLATIGSSLSFRVASSRVFREISQK